MAVASKRRVAAEPFLLTLLFKVCRGLRGHCLFLRNCMAKAVFFGVIKLDREFGFSHS
jgi:hypothetical protein